MTTTNINVHLRTYDPITLTALRSNGTEWVALALGTTEVTLFPADNNADRFLDHLAQEITAARQALALAACYGQVAWTIMTPRAPR